MGNEWIERRYGTCLKQRKNNYVAKCHRNVWWNNAAKEIMDEGKGDRKRKRYNPHI